MAAAAGVPVVKHGNRAASSACGAADVLEELGVAIDLPPEAVAACVDRGRHRLLLRRGLPPGDAPHPVPRRELGVPTAFNVLGPLTNPAQPRRRARRLRRRAARPGDGARCSPSRGDSVLVVRGDDGLDELTTTTTAVWVVGGGEVRVETLDPRALGIAGRDARGPARRRPARSTPPRSARCWRGEPGPVRDAVLLNAAGALVAADGAGAGPLAEVFPGGDEAGGVRDRFRRRAGGAGPLGRAVDIIARVGATAKRVRASSQTGLRAPRRARGGCDEQTASVEGGGDRDPARQVRPTENVASVSAFA